MKGDKKLPKVLPTAVVKRDREINAIIIAGMARQAKTDDEISIKLHITKRCFQDRRRNPGMFRLNELWTLCKELDLNSEEKATIMGEVLNR
jgi:hypothetical protein